MRVVLRILVFQLRDLLRGRWLVAYAIFFLVAGLGLLRLSGGDARAVLSLSNLVLFVVPLVCLVFGTTWLFDAREFNEMLLSQPVDRRELFAGMYGGVAAGLSTAFLVGAALPFLLSATAVPAATLITLLGTGVMLTLVFVAIAFLIALVSREKARALGAAVGVWLLATLVYDGVVLMVANAFAAFPLERPMLVLMMLNPVDLGRLLLLLQLDIAALMGYTGAVFQDFFGSGIGVALALAAFALWAAAPVAMGLRVFRRRDF